MSLFPFEKAKIDERFYVNFMEPSDETIDSVCLSYNHSFGLMSKEEQDLLRFKAKEWLHAWRKEFK